MTTNEPQYQVLVNEEGQFSLWPLNRQPASGWRETGTAGPRDECLAEVRRSWTDLRPRHLRD